MTKLLVTLHLAGLALLTQLEDRTNKRRDGRGSVTIEQVIWAVAVLAIAAIVYAAIKAFVTTESGKIK
jgi:hypothetical protein